MQEHEGNSGSIPLKSAVISPCNAYRYVLYRRGLNEGYKPVVFCMLNPSTADHIIDDPTIRRDIGFTRRLGGSELIVVNAYALRSTDPKELWKAVDPIGPDNDSWIKRCAQQVELSRDGIWICAWGAHIQLDRQRQVLDLIRPHVDPMALGVTKHGFPRHPLYLPKDAELEHFKGE